MKPLLDEIAEAMARTFYITTREHDPANNVGLEDTVEEYIKKWKDRFLPEAQAAIDVVERRLLDNAENLHILAYVNLAWQAVKVGYEVERNR